MSNKPAQLISTIKHIADTYPNRVSVKSKNGQLTYRELEQTSNNLALKLKELNVGPGILVAIYSNQCKWLAPIILSVMKRGAAYFPINPKFNPDQIGKQLTRSNSRLLISNLDHKLTQSDIQTQLPIIYFDPFKSSPSELDDSSLDKLVVSPGELDPIYAIATSGSTGEPKIALNHYSGVLNRLEHMSNAYSLGKETNTLGLTNYNFDSSFWEIFWPLSLGATTVITREEDRLDFEYIKQELIETKIAVIDGFSSFIELFLEYLDIDDSMQRGELSSLKYIFFGGERIKANTLKRFCFSFPNVSLINCYGCTETSIGSVMYECSGMETDEIPIGKPIENTGLLLIDEDGKECSPNEIGEIYLEGKCVGLGYLGNPSATKEKFQMRFFPDSKRGRLTYRTGDLGIQREDGNFVYRGRADYSSVKISGHRVDLETVWQSVSTSENVKACTVKVFDNSHYSLLVELNSNNHDITEEKKRILNLVTEYIKPKDINFPSSFDGHSSSKRSSIEFVNSGAHVNEI